MHALSESCALITPELLMGNFTLMLPTFISVYVNRVGAEWVLSTGRLPWGWHRAADLARRCDGPSAGGLARTGWRATRSSGSRWRPAQRS
jgi:hypothetical protein